MKRLFNNQKGFTLIELLIVIAVLGVLAAVVLAAINPLEQLRRGRDSGRLSSVSQLGHGMTQYMTAQNLTAPPTVSALTAGFQTVIKNAGEIVNVIQAPGSGSSCSASGNAIEGTYCYTASGNDFMIWTGTESESSKTRGGCTSTQFGIAVYKSYLGRSGIMCVGTAGAAPTDYTSQFPNSQ